MTIQRKATEYYHRISNIGIGGNGGGNSYNNSGNHPANWDDKRFFEYAEKWINEVAMMANWGDNPKAVPEFSTRRDLAGKLAEFPEPFLEDCVRYETTKQEIDMWLNLSPTERYQKKKREWSTHECSVSRRYGNTYSLQGKEGCTALQDGGCVQECEYYSAVGSISDEEILGWYRDIVGDMSYQELKQYNTQFIQDFIKLLKRQAEDYPSNQSIPQNYYPSILDII